MKLSLALISFALLAISHSCVAQDGSAETNPYANDGSWTPPVESYCKPDSPVATGQSCSRPNLECTFGTGTSDAKDCQCSESSWTCYPPGGIPREPTFPPTPAPIAPSCPPGDALACSGTAQKIPVGTVLKDANEADIEDIDLGEDETEAKASSASIAAKASAVIAAGAVAALL